LKKGLPAVNYLGDVAKPLEFDSFSESEENKEEKPAGHDQGDLDAEGESPKEVPPSKKVPPKADEYEWVWKVSSTVVCIAMSAVDTSPPHSRSLKLRDVHSSFEYTHIHIRHAVRARYAPRSDRWRFEALRMLRYFVLAYDERDCAERIVCCREKHCHSQRRRGTY
jgi:hypothetical protein